MLKYDWLPKLVEPRPSKNLGSNEPWYLGILWEPVLYWYYLCQFIIGFLMPWTFIERELELSKKKNRNAYFFAAYSRYFSTSIYRVINRIKRNFNLSLLRVRIYYHRFNDLEELLNGDLSAKIGQGIFSKDLMDKKCNCSLPSKLNGKYSLPGYVCFRSRKQT